MIHMRHFDFRTVLRSERGGVDLASVLVGVIVLGVLSTMLVQVFANATLLARVDNAKRNLYAIASVERTAAAGEGRYFTADELVTNSYLSAAPLAAIAVPADGRCFVAAVRGSANDMYYSTSESGRAIRIPAGAAEPDTSWCAPFPELHQPNRAVEAVRSGLAEVASVK